MVPLTLNISPVDFRRRIGYIVCMNETTTRRRHTMPAYEIHHDTYHPGEEVTVVEAKDAYEACIMWAGRFAPCRVIRVAVDDEGDTFKITPIDRDNGIVVEVFEAWEGGTR